MELLVEDNGGEPNPKDCQYPDPIVVTMTERCNVGVDSGTERPFSSLTNKQLQQARGGGRTCPNTDCVFHKAYIAAHDFSEFRRKQRNSLW